jgi:hypothetical protein
MSQVDDAHDTEEEGEAGGHEGVDTPEDEAEDDGLDHSRVGAFPM